MLDVCDPVILREHHIKLVIIFSQHGRIAEHTAGIISDRRHGTGQSRGSRILYDTQKLHACLG
jgi:hypothetical protein